MRIYLLIILILVTPIIALSQRPEPILIDEFQDTHCEGLRGRLDLFMADLSDNPGSKGVIVACEGRYRSYGGQTVAPVFGEVHQRMELFRNHFNFRRFEVSRITFISGGFREDHHVELWRVPPGGKSPQPKPTLDSMLYRKGKPTSVSESCP